MAPSAHFGVWVSVWVKARCTGLRYSIKNGLKGNPAHHLMGHPLSTRWWGIYEQNEYEQLKHIVGNLNFASRSANLPD